jgi:hypothetical protein
VPTPESSESSETVVTDSRILIDRPNFIFLFRNSVQSIIVLIAIKIFKAIYYIKLTDYSILYFELTLVTEKLEEA